MRLDINGIGTLVDIIAETPEELKINPYLICKSIAEQKRVLYDKSTAG